MPQELKEIKVNPFGLSEELELYRCFGWEPVAEPKKIKEENVSYEKRGKAIYEVKETLEFFRLRLKRDLNQRNHVALADLEKTYRELSIKYDNNLAPKCFTAKALKIAAWGLLLAGIPTLGILIWCLISYPQRLSSWKNEQEKIVKEKTAVRTEAEKLVI